MYEGRVVVVVVLVEAHQVCKRVGRVGPLSVVVGVIKRQGAL